MNTVQNPEWHKTPSLQSHPSSWFSNNQILWMPEFKWETEPCVDQNKQQDISNADLVMHWEMHTFRKSASRCWLKQLPLSSPRSVLLSKVKTSYQTIQNTGRNQKHVWTIAWTNLPLIALVCTDNIKILQMGIFFSKAKKIFLMKIASKQKTKVQVYFLTICK